MSPPTDIGGDTFFCQDIGREGKKVYLCCHDMSREKEIYKVTLVGSAGNEPELFMDSAKVYVNMGEAEVARHARFIGAFKPAGQAV